MTVVELVEAERRRLGVAMTAGGGLVALAVAMLLGAGAAVALGGARWIARPAAPLLAWMLVLGAVGVVLWWSARRVRREASRVRVAAAIERERALRAGELRSALEIADRGTLGRRAAERAAARLAAGGTALAPGLRRGARRQWRVALAGAFGALAFVLATRAAVPDGWAAMTHPVRAFRGTLLPRPAFENVPREVLRGERVRGVRIRAPGRRAVELHRRVTGTAWTTARLIVPPGASYVEADVGPIDADLMLVATDGRSVSDTVVIQVTDRPFVGDVAVRATYPRYLGRAAETLPAGEPMRVPQGTLLHLQGRASTALASVALTRSADTIHLRPDGHAFAGRFAPRASGTYRWLAASAAGAIADVPLPLELEIVPDSVPRVEILAPGGDTVLAADGRVLLRLAAGDDHGLTAVALRSWRATAAGGSQPPISQRLASSPPAEWSGELELDLTPRGLQPGDALHVVATATDDSPWQQTGQSRELVIRVPSSSELREMARRAADSAVARTSVAAAAQRQLEQRTGEAARSRGQRSTTRAPSRSGSAAARGGEQALSYESAEKARELVQQQRELAEKVKAAQQAAQELERQLRQAGALDTMLAARLAEAQRLLRDALTPELAEQLRAIEDAAQRLSGDDARASLAELQAQQQRLREQLEKSVEMLKRAALEGAMQTLRDEAREIAERERALADSLGRRRDAAGDSAPMAAEARQLAERSRDFSQDVAKLARRLEENKAASGAQRARTASERADQSAEAMQRAARQQARAESARAAQQQRTPPRASPRGQPSSPREEPTGDGDPEQEARESAGEAAERMEQAGQELAQAREQQISEWKQELTGELDQSIQEMLQLAREQQSLEQQARTGTPADGLRGEQSALQQGVDKAAERLQKAGQKSALLSGGSKRAVGEAQQRVADATEQTANARGGTDAADAMRDAAEALNKAAAALVRDRERAGRAASASGFAEMLQQMQEMAKQQGSLNAQAAGIIQIPSGQPGAGSAAARALARQQRALAQQLDDLGDGEGGGRARALAQEAKQIADALETGRVDAGTLQRQQQLFRRLLDAGRTLEQDERDETGKREARAASGEARFDPGATDAAGRAATRFREPTWDELRGLSAEERRAVLEYFRRINAQQP